MRIPALALGAVLTAVAGVEGSWFPHSPVGGHASPAEVEHPFASMDRMEVGAMSSLVQGDEYVHIQNKNHPVSPGCRCLSHSSTRPSPERSVMLGASDQTNYCFHPAQKAQ